MKLSNTSIVKSDSFFGAVDRAASEFFCESYASECMSGLAEDEQGLFKFCITDNSMNYSVRVTTEYFFCTAMPCGFVKVEHCSDVFYGDK